MVDKARCPACGDDEESPEHFLLRCPSHAHERWDITQRANKLRKPMTMETLLGIQEMARPLAKYIRATGRFEKSGQNTQI